MVGIRIYNRLIYFIMNTFELFQSKTIKQSKLDNTAVQWLFVHRHEWFSYLRETFKRSQYYGLQSQSQSHKARSQNDIKYGTFSHILFSVTLAAKQLSLSVCIFLIEKFPKYHDRDAFQKQNCTEGNIGPFSITPHFSRGVTKLLHDLENFHDVKPQEMLQIVWKQKHNRELGTCDNKILTPLLIRACLSWWAVWANFTFWAILFSFWRHPIPQK